MQIGELQKSIQALQKTPPAAAAGASHKKYYSDKEKNEMADKIDDLKVAIDTFGSQITATMETSIFLRSVRPFIQTNHAFPTTIDGKIKNEVVVGEKIEQLIRAFAATITAFKNDPKYSTEFGEVIDFQFLSTIQQHQYEAGAYESFWATRGEIIGRTKDVSIQNTLFNEGSAAASTLRAGIIALRPMLTQIKKRADALRASF